MRDVYFITSNEKLKARLESTLGEEIFRLYEGISNYFLILAACIATDVVGITYDILCSHITITRRDLIYDASS
ncbi:MAG: hypothetical protein NVSMB44_04240 [Ktedonobacteraceae bacterium]